MATIKSYSDLQQSKKLAEILPIESADMWWSRCIITDFGDGVLKVSYAVELCNITRFKNTKDDIPCWSLAALLGVLPVIIGDVLSENSLRLRIDKSETDFNVWYDNLDSGMVEEGLDIIKSNAVDAYYEMIIRLHELKML